MELHLTDEEASDLADVLDEVVSDLSPEIADTDNPNYRALLRTKRDRLRSIRSRLNGRA